MRPETGWSSPMVTARMYSSLSGTWSDMVHDLTERLRAREAVEERTAEVRERSELLDLAQDAITDPTARRHPGGQPAAGPPCVSAAVATAVDSAQPWTVGAG